MAVAATGVTSLNSVRNLDVPRPRVLAWNLESKNMGSLVSDSLQTILAAAATSGFRTRLGASRSQRYHTPTVVFWVFKPALRSPMLLQCQGNSHVTDALGTGNSFISVRSDFS